MDAVQTGGPRECVGGVRIEQERITVLEWEMKFLDGECGGGWKNGCRESWTEEVRKSHFLNLRPRLFQEKELIYSTYPSLI